MRGLQSVETPVGVPADVVWDAYRGLELGRLVDQLLPDVIGKVEVVQGDGGVGTIVKLTFPAGNFSHPSRFSFLFLSFWSYYLI